MTSLGQLIAAENGLQPDQVMLLRHSNRVVDAAQAAGLSIIDYTAIQPIGSGWDFHHQNLPRIEVVAVVTRFEVHAVYRVAQSSAQGTNTNREFAGDVYVEVQERLNEPPDQPCNKFTLTQVQSTAVGSAVEGWNQMAIRGALRSNMDTWATITVDADTFDRVAQHFQSQVASLQDTERQARLLRLARAPTVPARIEVKSYVFNRNPDVVAEVLYRANGHCEQCGVAAPFISAASQQPYLEVHHRVLLAAGGEDTVDNAIALCPNCHRRFHFGDWSTANPAPVANG